MKPTYRDHEGKVIEVCVVDKCCATCAHGRLGYEDEVECNALVTTYPDGKKCSYTRVFEYNVCDLWKPEPE